jgi:hypothetical protein
VVRSEEHSRPSRDPGAFDIIIKRALAGEFAEDIAAAKALYGPVTEWMAESLAEGRPLSGAGPFRPSTPLSPTTFPTTHPQRGVSPNFQTEPKDGCGIDISVNGCDGKPADANSEVARAQFSLLSWYAPLIKITICQGSSSP